jgi:uncharacterized membrane protein YbhN (UPF0104 family)
MLTGVEPSPPARPGRLRLFAAPAGQPLRRRAGDVLVLVPALLVLAALVLSQPPDRLQRDLARLLDAFPGWLDPVWAFGLDLLLLWAVLLLVVPLLARRWVVLLHALLALGAVVGLALLSMRLAGEALPDDLWRALLGGSGSPSFPAMRVAEAAAVSVTVTPHLIHPLQRLANIVLVAGAAGALFAGPATPAGVAAAVTVAVIAAAAVRLALGTSVGRPGLPAVHAGLAELGVRAGDLRERDEQVAGVLLLEGTDPEGRDLTVKVYGRDAYDSRVLAKLWRAIWYRQSGPSLGLSRARAVEHEALMTLLAANGGATVPAVVSAGTVPGDDAILVLRGRTVPLEGLSPAEVADDDPAGWWEQLRLLEGANVAHLDVDASTVAYVDGRPGLRDLGGAVVGPTPDQVLTDRAQLLAVLATTVGADRAVASARDALGPEGLAGLLPYLQSAAFNPRLRRRVRAAGTDVDDLAERAARAAGVTVPEPIRLRRVTWWTAVQTGLLVLAGAAVLRFFAGVDWAEFERVLRAASVPLLVVGALFGQLPRFAQAMATLGSVPVRLPYWPVYAMQLTTAYLNLALPSYVGRMTVSIRFFQRQALSPAVAVTSGAIESAAALVVQIALLTTILLFSNATLALDLEAPDGGVPTRLLTALAVVAVVAVLTVVLVPRIRRGVRDRLAHWVPEIRRTVGALRSWDKLGFLVTGNILTEVLFATTLGLFASAMGTDLSLAQLILINTGVSLLAGFIPVPGGIGVTEFGLTVGLTAAGMNEEAALAVALCQRIATFYLPPVWGFFAMRWLQRNRYL